MIPHPLSGLIIAEGDTGNAVFYCGACGHSFRARISTVVSLNNIPFCLRCVEEAQPARLANGLKPIPVIPGTYDPE